ncbi:MAG TPA: hypothetical protein IAC22_02360 [Candidatus Caccocola faecipullorum]|nr:hypothetical protein [Candidatus Caccocola faecipullorum]
MEQELLLFEDKFPCWDEETVALAGGDAASLCELEERGLLAEAGNGYVLTAEGEKKRVELAEESFLPVSPIGEFNAEKALWNNRFYHLMDCRAFTSLFPLGLKEYTVDETLPFAPALSRKELWTREEGKTRYIWPEHKLVKSFLKRFPDWGVATRGKPVPGQAAMDEWLAESGAQAGAVNFNLVLRGRYDFQAYRGLERLPDDIFHLKDADRFFFLRTSDKTPEDIYDAIGRLHLFMLNQRRVYVPGYADVDAMDLENWTMLVLAADTEAELEEVAARYSADGQNLIAPAMPLYIIGTSVERLRRVHEPKAGHYDWFDEDTVHIVRADENI